MEPGQSWEEEWREGRDVEGTLSWNEQQAGSGGWWLLFSWQHGCLHFVIIHGAAHVTRVLFCTYVKTFF